MSPSTESPEDPSPTPSETLLGPFIFRAAIARTRSSAGGSGWHYVPVPEEVVLTLRGAGVRRVFGEVDGHEFHRTLHLTAAGLGRIRFGTRWLRDAGLILGQKVTVAIRPEAEDHVEVPIELEEALGATSAAREGWDRLTPGRRRSLAYSVERAKRPSTKVRRAEGIVDEILLEMGLDPDA
jgi:hypothetical protein